MNILVSFNENSGLVNYSIPDLGLQQEIPYRVLPVKNSGKLVCYDTKSGHVKFDSNDENFKKLLKKEHEDSVLSACLDVAFLPTFKLGNPGSRVALAHDETIAFMKKVITEYAKTLQPKESSFGRFRRYLFGESEKEIQAKAKYDRVSKSDAINIVYDFQTSGICTRNPDGTWDSLVPFI